MENPEKMLKWLHFVTSSDVGKEGFPNFFSGTMRSLMEEKANITLCSVVLW